MSFSYVQGQYLTLQIQDIEDNESRPERTIQVRIIHMFRPFTLSCVFKVRTMGAQVEAVPRILKLYDHRFSQSLREEYHIKPYSDAIDLELQHYIESGAGDSFLRKLRRAEEVGAEIDDTEWNNAENELFLQKLCLDMYQAETAAYEALSSVQGSSTPMLVNTLHIPRPLTDKALVHNHSHYDQQVFGTWGVLLEFIPGFTLAELPENFPRHAWKGICDRAVRIVRQCGDLGILNKDVRPENFVVTPEPSIDQAGQATSSAGLDYAADYRVVMLDFAQCQLRSTQDSDADWGRRKWLQDEEGAVGMVMQHRLKQIADFDLEYEPALKYFQWAAGEDEDVSNAVAQDANLSDQKSTSSDRELNVQNNAACSGNATIRSDQQFDSLDVKSGPSKQTASHESQHPNK